MFILDVHICDKFASKDARGSSSEGVYMRIENFPTDVNADTGLVFDVSV